MWTSSLGFLLLNKGHQLINSLFLLRKDHTFPILILNVASMPSLHWISGDVNKYIAIRHQTAFLFTVWVSTPRSLAQEGCLHHVQKRTIETSFSNSTVPPAKNVDRIFLQWSPTWQYTNSRTLSLILVLRTICNRTSSSRSLPKPSMIY